MIQDIDVFEHPVVIAYPPGSGGNRLRRILLKMPWTSEPKQELHRLDEIRKYTIDEGYPKFPGPNNPTEVEDPALSKYPVLTTHGMHSRYLRHAFPDRKIVKVYCEFREAFYRHWVVFGRRHTVDYINANNLLPLNSDDIYRYLEWNMSYYRDNFDFEHDYAVCIAPGQSEFADFMIKEFQECNDPDWERAWWRMTIDANYIGLADIPVLKTVLPNYQENLDSGIVNA